MGDLTGKVALVTGSTHGVGKAIAETLANSGAEVFLNARQPSETSIAAVSSIREVGGSVGFVAGDITSIEGANEVAAGMEERGRLDVLVVSGGATVEHEEGPYFFETMPLESLANWAARQWFSRMYVLQACLPLLKKGVDPCVVFITTDAGRYPTPSELAPGGSGAALIMSTKVLGKELARYQIRVNAVALTVTADTPGLERVLSPGVKSRSVFEKALAKQSFPVYSDDIAEATHFFASKRSRAITGQTLSVNGGVSFPG